jgi:hydrocephalus-inducing protein
MEGQPEYKKGVFWFEPERLEIPKNDVPHEVRVWAIPDEARKYRDDLILMIRDNPTPVTLPMQCLGARPVVEIVEGSEPVRFDRLLLKQQARREIRLRNNGFIPVRWRLSGVENLPDVFALQNTSGELKPTQETTVEVVFHARKELKYTEKIVLEVEDAEGLGVRQDAKTIPIEAEAFDISVELKFPQPEGLSQQQLQQNADEGNMLYFGAVRVGDLKDQYFSVKNTGLYQV